MVLSLWITNFQFFLLSKKQIMKSNPFLFILTIFLFLFVNQSLYSQCHGGGSSQSTKETSPKAQPETIDNTDELIFYACPMHPEIKSLKSETCSKCGMNLEQKKASIVKTELQKDSVYYTCSMHPEVKESKPGSCPKCGMELIKKSTNPTSSKENMKMTCPMMQGTDDKKKQK